MNSGPLLPILIFVAAITGFIAIARYASKKAKERSDAFAVVSSRLNLQFWPDRIDPIAGVHDQFSRFSSGHSRSAYNTLSGTASNLQITAGDYTFKTESGTGKDRRTTTHHFSYVLAVLPFSDTPSLAVRPENFLDKFAGAIGFEDIDFESAEFSRMFHVKSSDKKFAYDVIDPRMMEFLMNPMAPAFELNRGRLLIAGGSTWDPARFEQTIGWMTQFVAHWPEHVQRILAARS